MPAKSDTPTQDNPETQTDNTNGAVELVWEDPPATTRNSKAEALYEALKANKGKWAKYPASSSAAFAFKRRFDGVEVTTRQNQPYVRVP